METAKKSVLQLVQEAATRQKNSGGYQNIFYMKEVGSQKRVRFLEDFESCHIIKVHQKWLGKWPNSTLEYKHPCLNQYSPKLLAKLGLADKYASCPHCDDRTQGASTMDMYVWQLWNYESGKIELFCADDRKNSPLYLLAGVFKAIDSIVGQDLIFSIPTEDAQGRKQWQILPSPRVAPFNEELLEDSPIWSPGKVLFNFFQANNQIEPTSAKVKEIKQEAGKAHGKLPWDEEFE